MPGGGAGGIRSRGTMPGIRMPIGGRFGRPIGGLNIIGIPVDIK